MTALQEIAARDNIEENIWAAIQKWGEELPTEEIIQILTSVIHTLEREDVQDRWGT